MGWIKTDIEGLKPDQIVKVKLPYDRWEWYVCKISKDDIKNKYVIHNSTGLQINLNEIYKLE
jgi:hypothetical protein